MIVRFTCRFFRCESTSVPSKSQITAVSRGAPFVVTLRGPIVRFEIGVGPDRRGDDRPAACRAASAVREVGAKIRREVGNSMLILR